MLSSIKAATGIVLSALLVFGTTTNALARSSSDETFYKNLFGIYQTSKFATPYKNSNIHFSPSISNLDRKKYLSAINRSLGFWNNTNLGNINILIWSPKDLQWSNKKHYEVTKSWGASETALSDDIATINGKTACVESSNNTVYIEEVPNHMTLICHGEGSGPWYSHVISHELTHIWQMSVVGPENSSKVPVWLSEGSAIYYGLALNGINQKGAKSNFKKMYSDYARWDRYGKSLYQQIKKTPSALARFVHRASFVEPSDAVNMRNASYHYGSLIIAGIIERYGHEKFMEYYASFSKSTDYSKNFKEVFGITIESFCATIAKNVVDYLD